MVKVLEGNNLDLIKDLTDNSIDSIVTDPPYGLGDPPDCYAVMRDWVEKGYYEVKGKGGFMGKCYHPDTDILTEKGWVKVHQVKIGDSVASLNASTNELEAEGKKPKKNKVKITQQLNIF